MDKIGEVIGPKGKVINTIQQETGADIAVDDDGLGGIVTIGAVEAWRMEEAKARIHGHRVARRWPRSAPPTMGTVVNITKFGAFVNILPGRDGLVHIRKLGKGKRINNVEDVLHARSGDRGHRRGDRREGQGQPDPRRLVGPGHPGDGARPPVASSAAIAPWRSIGDRGRPQFDRRASARRLPLPHLPIAGVPCRSTTRSMPNSPASSAISAPVAKPAATPVRGAGRERSRRRPRRRPRRVVVTADPRRHR